MTTSFLPRFLLTAVLGALLALPAVAQTLYNGALGTLPTAQGWSTLSLGAAGSESMVSGVYQLDTTGAGVVYYGNARISATPLDTATGFTLQFNLKVLAETHTDSSRAGFSVLVTGADPTRALEIAFWTDHVWTYDYNGGFVHGADVAFDTTAALHSYTLAIANQQYQLSANGSLLLSGALKDYTPGGAPYTTPNFIFFGDDTSRGTSITQMASMTLTPVPEPAALALWLAGLAAVGGTAVFRRSAAR
jgi:hypothetical protein